jgi:hypothetical protein
VSSVLRADQEELEIGKINPVQSRLYGTGEKPAWFERKL